MWPICEPFNYAIIGYYNGNKESIERSRKQHRIRQIDQFIKAARGYSMFSFPIQTQLPSVILNRTDFMGKKRKSSSYALQLSKT